MSSLSYELQYLIRLFTSCNFLGQRRRASTSTETTVTFKIVQKKTSRVAVVVMDVSGSMVSTCAKTIQKRNYFKLQNVYKMLNDFSD